MPSHYHSVEYAALRLLKAREAFGDAWFRYTGAPSHRRFMKMLEARQRMIAKHQIMRVQFGLTNQQQLNLINRLYARARAPRCRA